MTDFSNADVRKIVSLVNLTFANRAMMHWTDSSQITLEIERGGAKSGENGETEETHLILPLIYL